MIVFSSRRICAGTLFWIGFFWLVLIVDLHSQGNPPALQDTGRKAEGTEKHYKIRATVEEVRLDAVVLKKGRQVTDLTAKDFEIYQDGKLQKVNSCIYVAGVQTEPAKSAISSKDSASAPLLPVPMLTPDKVRRVIAFIVDDLAMDMHDVKYARRALERFVNNQMQPGDLVAILLTKRGVGALQLFVSDKRQLLALIKSIRWGFSVGETGIPQFMAISYCIKAMQDLPGLRKTLIVITTQTSVPGQMDPDFNRAAPPNNPINVLADAALRAGVAIHMMNIRGLSIGLPTFHTEATSSNAMDEWLQFVKNVLSFRPNPLPRKTGGILVEDSNFFSTKSGIGDLSEELKGYYLLTYTPPADTFKANKQGMYHRIIITVKQSGTRVHTRDGFFGTAEPLIAPAGNRNPLREAIFSPFKNNDLKVNLALGYVDDSPNGYLLRSWLHVDAAGLSAVEEKDGTHVTSLDTAHVVSDVNDFSQGSGILRYEFRTQKENLAWVREHGFRFSAYLSVKKPGAYYVRAGVRDVQSGKIGSAYQFVEIPDLKKHRLSLSSIFVIDREEDVSWIQSRTREEFQTQLQPDVRRDPRGTPAIRSYLPGESFEYMAVIYNAKSQAGQAPDLENQYVLFKDGSEVYKSEPETVDLTGAKDLERTPIRKKLHLEDKMMPGDYVLLLRVKDRHAKEKRNIAVQALDFEIVDSRKEP